jgi:hypothetical protein
MIPVPLLTFLGGIRRLQCRNFKWAALVTEVAVLRKKRDLYFIKAKNPTNNAFARFR